MAQHRWRDALPGHVPTTSAGRRTARKSVRRLLSADVVLTLLVVTGGLRVLPLSSPESAPAAEPANVAHVLALSQLTSFTDTGHTGTAPFGWWQLAGYTIVSRAFEREPDPVAAVREMMVLAAVLCAVLLWILARRLDLPHWAATTAVVLMAVSPFAIALQRVVLVEHLAVTWLLAGLVLVAAPAARARPWQDVLAACCFVAAVLTSPLTLLMLPAAGWLLVRRRDAPRVAFTAVVFTLGLGAAFGPAASALRPESPGAGPPGIDAWVALDPVFVVLSMVAIVAGMVLSSTRPFALAALLLSTVLAWPDVAVEAALALLIPLTSLLIAGVAATVTARRPPAGHRRARLRHPMPALVLVSVLAVTSVAGWIPGFSKLRPGPSGEAVLAQARDWLRDNASGATVLADDAGWAALAADGWPTGSLIPIGACSAGCPPSEWAVLTAAGRREQARFPAAEAFLDGTTKVAVFGSGPDTVTVSRFGQPPDLPGDAEESSARARAGAALATSPRVLCDGRTRDALTSGMVDPRLIATIAALATLQPVRLVDFPSVPGETAAGQPLRGLVLTGAGVTGKAAENAIAEFYAGQRATFEPLSVTRVPDGVLVKYPLFPPPGLLTPFSSS